MTFLSPASSSGTKPCCHHTSAVVAAALAIWGRARDPAATRPSELCNSERRVNLVISVSFLAGAANLLPARSACCRGASRAASASRDRVFREDLLGSFERLLRGG